MDIQEVREKIEDHIAKGHADKAMAELIKYTKATKSPMHEDVLVLSGQLRQWKRDSMLGVQQSSNEVSRIKMGILAIMKSLEQAPLEEPPTPPVVQPVPSPVIPPVVQQMPVTKTATSGSSNNTTKILGGVGGLILLLAIAWFAMNRGGESPADPVTSSEQTDSLALTAKAESAAAQQTDDQAKSETPPAQEVAEEPTPTARRTTTTNNETASTSTKTRTPVTSREITLPEIVATVSCGGRTYKLGSNNRVYDTTSSVKKIGTSTEEIRCVEGVLVAKIVPQYGGYLTYYNKAKNDWMETMAEAKQ